MGKIKASSVRKRVYSDDKLARYEIVFYVNIDDIEMFDKSIKEFMDGYKTYFFWGGGKRTNNTLKNYDMELTTFELIDELIKKPKEEILYALFMLMCKDKRSWDDLNKAYIKYLEATKKDMTKQLIEAETCVMESFHDKKTKDKNKIFNEYLICTNS